MSSTDGGHRELQRSSVCVLSPKLAPNGSKGGGAAEGTELGIAETFVFFVILEISATTQLGPQRCCGAVWRALRGGIVFIYLGSALPGLFSGSKDYRCASTA